MRTRKLVDANLDYLRNGQGVPIAHGRTAENVLASEEFKRQSIETHMKKKKASFKGVRGEEPVDKWHSEAEQYIREVYSSCRSGSQSCERWSCARVRAGTRTCSAHAARGTRLSQSAMAMRCPRSCSS